MQEKLLFVYQYVRDTQVPLYLVLALFVVWAYAFNRRAKPRREPQVVTKAQEATQEENATVADAIHEGLFNAYCDGRISRERYRNECYRLAAAYNLTDLRPRSRSFVKATSFEMTRLKDEIIRRLDPQKVKVAIVRAHQAPKPSGNGKLNISIKGARP